MGRTFYINESALKSLNETIDMTEYKFISNVKNFLSMLLSDPVNAQPSLGLQIAGLDRKKLINLLKDNNLLVKKEKIADKDENGNPKRATMMISFKVPKENFDLKLKKLYISLFEKNETPYDFIYEDGGAGACAGGCNGGSGTDGGLFSPAGATSASTSGDYQYTMPLFGVSSQVSKKKKKKDDELIDETDCSSVGDYQYDAPPFIDDASANRTPGNVAMNGGFKNINKNDKK